jgi:hypothetical protein
MKLSYNLVDRTEVEDGIRMWLEQRQRDYENSPLCGLSPVQALEDLIKELGECELTGWLPWEVLKAESV